MLSRAILYVKLFGLCLLISGPADAWAEMSSAQTKAGISEEFVEEVLSAAEAKAGIGDWLTNVCAAIGDLLTPDCLQIPYDSSTQAILICREDMLAQCRAACSGGGFGLVRCIEGCNDRYGPLPACL